MIEKPPSEDTVAIFKEAQQVARRWQHEYVGTEHVLLAMCKVEGQINQILCGCGCMAGAGNLAFLEELVGRQMQRGPDVETMPAIAPWTPRLKVVMERARAAANAGWAVTHVDTVHVLIGLIQEGQGLAFQALHQLGYSVTGIAEHLANRDGNGPATRRSTHE